MLKDLVSVFKVENNRSNTNFNKIVNVKKVISEKISITNKVAKQNVNIKGYELHLHENDAKRFGNY